MTRTQAISTEEILFDGKKIPIDKHHFTSFERDGERYALWVTVLSKRVRMGGVDIFSRIIPVLMKDDEDHLLSDGIRFYNGKLQKEHIERIKERIELNKRIADLTYEKAGKYFSV